MCDLCDERYFGSYPPSEQFEDEDLQEALNAFPPAVRSWKMPNLQNKTRWTGTDLDDEAKYNLGPVTREQLKDELDHGCYAFYQLLGNRLAIDEAGLTAAELIEQYWNCWRSEFEKDLRQVLPLTPQSALLTHYSQGALVPRNDFMNYTPGLWTVMSYNELQELQQLKLHVEDFIRISSTTSITNWEAQC